MNYSKVIAVCIFLYSIINIANAQSTPHLSINKITGPNWINATQTVAVCQPTIGGENCVTVTVQKAIGKMTGLLKVRPLRNTSVSWWAFTTKSLAVCGLQMTTRKNSCVPVEGLSGESLPVYPLRISQLEELMSTLVPYKAEFLMAGRKVSTALASAEEMSTDNDHCYETGECVEDMPVVIIDGGGGGGGGNFGYGFEGWGGYGDGGSEAGDENPQPGGVDDIDPSTGQPYPRVTIFPPPPRWPSVITWCSMVGLFCPKDPFAASKPSKAECDAARARCYTRCTDIYVANPENLPGSGTDYPSRYRKCMRECLAESGCAEDY